MPTSQRVDLAGLFQSVVATLAENQQTLDRMDEYNHDHGDNMVQTFQTISSALEQKRGSSDSAALAYAARQLGRSANSGSSKLYAENLAQAATQFKGRRVDANGALQLLQTLIGATQGGGQPAQQPTPSGGMEDLLGSLLGGMGGQGSGQTSQQPTPSGGMEDLLGSLLGGMGGQGSNQTSQQPTPSGGMEDLLGSLLGGQGTQQPATPSGGQGMGLQNLLAAGMAYLQARQTGQGSAQALAQAFAAASGMGSSAHREQSTQLVVQAFLQALSAMQAGR